MRSPVALAALAALALAPVASAAEPAPAPRATRDLQFTVRAVTVSAHAGAKEPPATRFFTDAELTAFLTAAQNDPNANTVQYPRITVRGTQRAEVSVLDKQTFVTGIDAVNVKGQPVFVPRSTEIELGVRCDVWGRVSADANAVELRFAHEETRVVGEVPLVPVTVPIQPVAENGKKGKPIPFTQYVQLPTIETARVSRSDLMVPSGGHVVIAGPAFEREVRTEFGPPVVSNIPYLNRLFKNVEIGREPARTFFIVSPVVGDESAP
jgi:type II secretory pathway component GspD/PulD (secretin)